MTNRTSNSDYIIESAAKVVGFGLVFFTIVWLIWEAYLKLIAYFYPTAPEHVLHPSYWMFVLAWVSFLWITNFFKK